jgi:integrase
MLPAHPFFSRKLPLGQRRRIALTINLQHQIIAVNRTAGKNKYRRREVPLTDPRCVWALNQLLERSYRLAGRSPEMYLFPARASRGNFNGEFHMGPTGIRKQFEAVRDAADLKWFNLNGWRHTAITRMAEAGIPIGTIMARAGHCSPKMTAHYTHISMQAERMAMQGMTNGRKSTQRPPDRPGKASGVDLMDPAIQAEIARQVALALQRKREHHNGAAPVEAPANGPQLVRFPGGAQGR